MARFQVTAALKSGAEITVETNAADAAEAVQQVRQSCPELSIARKSLKDEAEALAERERRRMQAQAAEAE